MSLLGFLAGVALVVPAVTEAIKAATPDSKPTRKTEPESSVEEVDDG